MTLDPRESQGVNEQATRAIEAKVAGEAFLSALTTLIEREATRAKVEYWLAQACLVNGVDPASRRVG